jgi:hypothetical protein
LRAPSERGLEDGSFLEREKGCFSERELEGGFFSERRMEKRCSI